VPFNVFKTVETYVLVRVECGSADLGEFCLPSLARGRHRAMYCYNAAAWVTILRRWICTGSAVLQYEFSRISRTANTNSVPYNSYLALEVLITLTMAVVQKHFVCSNLI